jgi:hypothetical protein
MRIDQTTAGGGGGRNDEDNLKEEGIFFFQLTECKDIPPKAGEKDDRVVFEFTVADGPHKGKKVATFCRKNLFPGKPGVSKPSNLYKTLRSLGVSDPMQGCDTDALIGKPYQIVCKRGDTGDRVWPEAIMPAGMPTQTNLVAGTAAAAPIGPSYPVAPAAGPPPRRSSTPAEPSYFLDAGEVSGIDHTVLLPVSRIKALVAEKPNLDWHNATVAKQGGDWEPLTVAVPASKDWLTVPY